MGYALRDQLSFCHVGERTVFLDLRADRYFCLPLSAEAAFARLQRGDRLSVTEQDALSPLIRDGFLCEQPGAADVRPCLPVPPPVISLLDVGAPLSPMRHVALAMWDIAMAALQLRRRPLSLVLSGMDRPRPNGPGRSPAQISGMIAPLCAAFHRAGLVVGQHDKCLPRAIAMMRFMARFGVAADLVFGVQMRPFAAHCWVQHGRVLLGDRVERVRDYTPILVI